MPFLERSDLINHAGFIGPEIGGANDRDTFVIFQDKQIPVSRHKTTTSSGNGRFYDGIVVPITANFRNVRREDDSLHARIQKIGHLLKKAFFIFEFKRKVVDNFAENELGCHHPMIPCAMLKNIVAASVGNERGD